MTAYDRVLDALRDHGSRIDEHHGRDAHAQCPAHDDGRPSLHVTGIEGQALIYCHAQCHTDDVLAELGMTPRDLFDEPAGAAYQYVDTTGELLRTVQRSPDKRFTQQVHDKTRVVLYRLPEVMQAVQDGRRLWICEGEKDVHTLEALGEVATTAPQGSASFKKVDVSPLKGATVRAVVDRDEAGKKWADLVAATVGPIADLEFLEAAHGKDVTDHVMAGGTLDTLTPVAVDIPEVSQDEGAPEPTPLNPTPTVPGFPVDALPDWWADYVSALSTATQTPADMVASVTLGVLSTCMSGRVTVQPGPQWSEPTNLYTTVAMPPGTRKSSVFSAATRPLREVEKELAESARPLIEQQAALKSLREDQANALRKQAVKGDSAVESEYLTATTEAQALEVPAVPRLLADDATPEAIASLAATQGGRLAIAAAEGGIFDIFAGRYNSGVPNLDVLLRGHAGDAYRVDRKGREPEHIESLTLTFILTVQPSVLRQIGETPVEKSRGELERFLYSVPSSSVGYRTINPPPVPPTVAGAYETNVSALARRYADEDTTATLTLDQAATQRFAVVQERVEASLRPDGNLGSPRLIGWGSKLAGAIARIAGIIHLANGHADSDPIGAESVDAATQIGEYYAGHAVAAFDLMDRTAPNAKAEELLTFIRSHGLTEFSTRDLMVRISRSRFPSADDLTETLNVLVDYGWIIPQEIQRKRGPGRPPSPRFTVHPRVFQDGDTVTQSTQYTETHPMPHFVDSVDSVTTPVVSNITPAVEVADSDPDEDVDLFGDPLPPTPRADGKCQDCGNPLHKGRCVRCEVEGRRSA
ncbi:Protein of unknown function (DUF3987) [Brevibacterium sp. Mu109]|uniref:DUF3987 domain-containing protein n=1 Tax=Brevibacterium sp. Mu109 TaxID=1255669 RepID=UPI000C5D7069|nr:YfjI family protein [Brevibacterium sp. Mu109]SMX65437.1 Protein of unknown function (DUF3987) [Brevibacterium sp. Mu109]